MAGLLRPSVGFERNLSKQIYGAALAATERKTRQAAIVDGEAMVREATRIFQGLYQRRSGPTHKPNTTHGEESFTSRVSGSTFPFRVELTIKPGVDKRKIAALNFGIKKPYEIASRDGGPLAWDNPTGYGRKVTLIKGGVVQRNPKPGTPEYEGGHFLEQARDEVVRRRLATGV